MLTFISAVALVVISITIFAHANDKRPCVMGRIGHVLAGCAPIGIIPSLQPNGYETMFFVGIALISVTEVKWWSFLRHGHA